MYCMLILTISKMAASAMTETVMPPEMLANIKVRSQSYQVIIHTYNYRLARIRRTIRARRYASIVSGRCLWQSV